MLMRRIFRPIVVLICVLAIALLEAWALGRIPTYAKYCEYNQYTEHEKCASYHVTIVAIRYIGQFLDAIAPALTALATVFIGGFTATIWWANKEQIRHNRQTERAYLWPGFAGHLGRRFTEEGRAAWNISLLNTGRTVGIITEIYHALVSEADHAAGRFRYTRITDIGELVPPSRPTEEIPSGVVVEVREGSRISCGYIVYTDVYGDTHEQAWKHRLHARGAAEALPRCYSDPPDKNH
jgi:hypothetical protein